MCGYLYEVFSLEILLDITVTFSMDTTCVIFDGTKSLNKSFFMKVFMPNFGLKRVSSRCVGCGGVFCTSKIKSIVQ